MYQQVQSRTQGLKEMIKHSPDFKQKVIEMFDFMSKAFPKEPIKSFFNEIESAISKSNISQLESYFNIINKMPMEFKEHSDTLKLDQPTKNLYIKDEEENVVCQYELSDDKIEACLKHTNNKDLSDRLIISYNNGKCFIQQSTMTGNNHFVSVLVNNPQIYDGNLFCFGNSTISCSYKKGKFGIKYRANGMSLSKKLKNTGYDYKIVPEFNLCCEKAEPPYIKNGSIVNENKRWIIYPHNCEKVCRALHTMDTYKNRKPSYPLTAYDGMEFFFTDRIFKVSIRL